MNVHGQLHGHALSAQVGQGKPDRGVVPCPCRRLGSSEDVAGQGQRFQ